MITQEEAVTERINISYGHDAITIDRRLSPSLTNELSRLERSHFCHQVDEKLKPLNSRIQWVIALVPFQLLTLCGTLGSSIRIGVVRRIWMFLILPVVFLLVHFLVNYMLLRKAREIHEDIQNDICRNLVIASSNRQQQQQRQQRETMYHILHLDVQFHKRRGCLYSRECYTSIIDVTTCKISTTTSSP